MLSRVPSLRAMAIFRRASKSIGKGQLNAGDLHRRKPSSEGEKHGGDLRLQHKQRYPGGDRPGERFEACGEEREPVHEGSGKSLGGTWYVSICEYTVLPVLFV